MSPQTQRLLRYALLIVVVVIGAIFAQRRQGDPAPQAPPPASQHHRLTVDLAATLDRIDSGEKLRFHHDGSVFENRERRLPAKPTGYYREWVHPTPGEDGPGARRVVTGKEGEAWYTPDHYKTFERVR
jgi:guanyl-specific ribonuclease Sa